jgi:hypothetical protein
VGFRRACLLTITAAVAAVTACAEPSATSGATPLTLVGAPAATSLTLRDAAEGQEGVASTDGEVRLRTALRVDDDATARLCGVLVGRALEAGLLINVTRDRVIRMLPPLLINKTEADEIIKILVPLIKAFNAEQ